MTTTEFAFETLLPACVTRAIRLRDNVPPNTQILGWTKRGAARIWTIAPDFERIRARVRDAVFELDSVDQDERATLRAAAEWESQIGGEV